MAKQAHIIYMPQRAAKPVARPETNPEQKKNRKPKNTHKLYPASLRLSISRFDELFNGISLTHFPCCFGQIKVRLSHLPSSLSIPSAYLLASLDILLCNLIKI